MQVTASQIFRELDEGKWSPFYLIVGEEPFQAGEILARLKKFFKQGDFNSDSFDGEHLDVGALVSSVDMLPGLFDDHRLVLCQRVDKVAPSSWEAMDAYFANPSPSTCFVMTAAKVDKRKTWVKQAEKLGRLVEISEPYERDLPRWQTYFQTKLKKQIESEAWALLTQSCGGSLSLMWSAVQTAATYVGDSTLIRGEDVAALVSGSSGDVFELAEEVLCRRPGPSMRLFHQLLRSGENEIKILSILLRQFRLVDHCARLMSQGITDGKTIASQIGTHPFFVPKIMGQAKHHTTESLRRAFELLTESDFKLKAGDGGLFENFLVPYFSKA
jgi:DNA polymerase-3 subunit delta